MSGRPELWGAVQVALGTAYPYTGAMSLARQTNEATWAYLSGLPASPTLPNLQARVCAEMGRLLKHTSPKTALEWLQRGLATIAGDNQPDQAAYISILLGSVQITLGDYAAARQAVEQTLGLLPAHASYTHCGALINLGLIDYYQGHIDQAVAHTEQALELARQIYADFLIVTILGNLGLFKDVAGDWDAAIDDYRQAAVLAERLGSQDQRALMEMNIGLLSINRGDDETALHHLATSLDLARVNQQHEYTLGCLSGLTDLHLRRNEADGAEPFLLEAVQIAQSFEKNYRLSELYRRWTELRLSWGDLQGATNDAAQALELARILGDPTDEGLSLRTQGQVLRAAGDLGAASMSFQQSTELLAYDPYEAARTQVGLALTLCDLGAVVQGRAMLVEAQTIFARLGAERDLKEVATLLERITNPESQRQ
jgi:tetratricopeptide (TPR) repeat protein